MKEREKLKPHIYQKYNLNQAGYKKKFWSGAKTFSPPSLIAIRRRSHILQSCKDSWGGALRPMERGLQGSEPVKGKLFALDEPDVFFYNVSYEDATL